MLNILLEETKTRIEEFIKGNIQYPVSPSGEIILRNPSTARYLSELHLLMMSLGISRKVNEFWENYLHIEYVCSGVSVTLSSMDKYLSCFNDRPVVINNFDFLVKIINIVVEMIAVEVLCERKHSFQLVLSSIEDNGDMLETYQVHMYVNNSKDEMLRAEVFHFESDVEAATTFYNYCIKLDSLRI